MNEKIIYEKMSKYLDNLSDEIGFHYDIQNMHDVRRNLNTDYVKTSSILSEKELNLFKDFKMPKKALQWLSGRIGVKNALTKMLFAQGLELSPAAVDVLNGIHSAPYIHQYPGIKVSITHCYPFCIAVVSKTAIGVDLEKSFEPMEEFIQRYYAEDEIKFINIQTNLNKRCGLALYYWTRKEAASKLIGLGMLIDYRTINTVSLCPRIEEVAIELKSCAIDEFCLSLAHM